MLQAAGRFGRCQDLRSLQYLALCCCVHQSSSAFMLPWTQPLNRSPSCRPAALLALAQRPALVTQHARGFALSSTEASEASQPTTVAAHLDAQGDEPASVGASDADTIAAVVAGVDSQIAACL